MSDEYLPLDAVPYLVRLMRLYNNSLQELIEMFHLEKNENTFSKLLDHLVDDFDYYHDTYIHWLAEAKAPKEQAQLRKLASLLQEAKDLISEAVALVRQ